MDGSCEGLVLAPYNVFCPSLSFILEFLRHVTVCGIRRAAFCLCQALTSDDRCDCCWCSLLSTWTVIAVDPDTGICFVVIYDECLIDYGFCR